MIETTATMDEASARRLTDDIRDAAVSKEAADAALLELLVDAFRGRAWLALGYTTWEEWVTAERLNLPTSAIEAMSAEGMSTRAIAAVTGVSAMTVSRSASVTNVTVAGLDGRTTRGPGKRPTPVEIARRRDIAVELWNAGYRRDPICHALGVAHGTLSEDLVARGVDRSVDRGRLRTSEPPPEPWRDADMPPGGWPKRTPPPPTPKAPTKRYDASDAASRLHFFASTFETNHFANDIAHAVYAALADDAAKDAQPWLAQLRETVDTIYDQVLQLLWIIHDAKYRAACMETGKADVPLPGPRPPLRSVS